MAGKYTPLLILMLIGNAVLPIAGLCFKKIRRSVTAMFWITVLVNVGMFIERYLIIVPSLSHKNMPFIWGTYSPSWVELSVTAAAFCGFTLMYVLFAKFFPLVAVTDVRELGLRHADIRVGRAEKHSLTEEE